MKEIDYNAKIHIEFSVYEWMNIFALIYCAYDSDILRKRMDTGRVSIKIINRIADRIEKKLKDILIPEMMETLKNPPVDAKHNS